MAKITIFFVGIDGRYNSKVETFFIKGHIYISLLGSNKGG